MAVGLENFPNIIPADADYLNGDIKDTPSGTPVNRQTNGDIQQFFRKLMREASISPNGLRDNETNGFQLYESLLKAGKPYDVYSVTLQQTGTGAPVELAQHTNELSGNISWTRSGAGTYTGTLAGAFAANKVFILVSTTTFARILKGARFDDDNLIFGNFDFAGVAQDSFTAHIEIRVYR